MVNRIKELWQANYVQKRMLEVLTGEGWDIDELKLGRIRRKHGVFLRLASGYNGDAVGHGTGQKRKRGIDGSHAIEAVSNLLSEGGSVLQSHDETMGDAEHVPASSADVLPEAHGSEHTQLSTIDTDKASNLPPAIAAQRAQRLVEIQAQSDEQLQSKKRRRRIRGLAHLPPDQPGLPPRYKSETSLDECKSFLHLDNDLYKSVRSQFEAICIEAGIIKKRFCQPGAWQEAKNRLVRENTHLAAVLNPVHADIEKRDNALEVVCADVTKRMRMQKKQIFLKDANNILGLDPEQSKAIRRQFYEILKEDQFESMLLCGKEHYAELKQRWIDDSPFLQQMFSAALDEDKKRSIDVLLRDATKRYNDDNVAKIPHLTRSSNTSYGPGPGPAPRSKKEAKQETKETRPRPVQQDLDIDPALLASLGVERVNSTLSTQTTATPGVSAHMTETTARKIPAYFHLSTASQLDEPHPKVWLASMAHASLAEVLRAAASKSASVVVEKVFGILKNDGADEDLFQIDTTDELEAYLQAVQDMSAKVAFLIQLATKH